MATEEQGARGAAKDERGPQQNIKPRKNLYRRIRALSEENLQSLVDDENVPELQEGLRWWFEFYNEKRPHTALPGRITPQNMYEKCFAS